MTTLHPLIHAEFVRQHESEIARAARRPHPGTRRFQSGSSRATTEELAAVVRAAQTGNREAWATLVVTLTPAVRVAARRYRLNAADTEDVVQTTWTAAVTHITRLRRPGAIIAWLIVSAQREAIRILHTRRRETPVDQTWDPLPSDQPASEITLLLAEERTALRAAVDRLPNQQRTVVHALLESPGSSYRDLATKLDIPVGSIGPTRQRALDRLGLDQQLEATLRPSIQPGR